MVSMKPMERETFRLPAEDLENIEELVDKGYFTNKSDAFRRGVELLIEENGHYLDETPESKFPWRK